MYSVMIADDESIIRRGLKSVINWENAGFTVVCEASGGTQALQQIRSFTPDLVLIDIRMPGVTGLDVIKQSREEGYAGHFIILSGYSDFAYAQTAIHYGVDAYLTKPVETAALEEALGRIRNTLQQKDRSEDSKNRYVSHAREKVLAELLSGQLTPEEAPDLKELGVGDGPWQVLFYEKYSYDIMEISYDLSDILHESGRKKQSYDHLTINSHNVILLSGQLTIDELHSLIAKFTKELPPEKNSPLDSVFITCGRIVNELNDLPLSYQDARILLDRRFYCDESQHILRYDEGVPVSTTPANVNTTELLKRFSTDLIGYIQTCNRSGIVSCLHVLRSELTAAALEVITAKRLLIDLYLNVKEKLTSLYPSADIPFPISSEAIARIRNSYYLYEIIAYLSEQTDLYLSAIGYSPRESIIDDVITYIERNYADSLTLEKISPLFGYNASYLGKIFSRRMGINFNAYLDQVRIEHAKELLRDTKLPVYKVSETVGYNNVDYFHIKFKKYTGASPAGYRKDCSGE